MEKGIYKLIQEDMEKTPVNHTTIRSDEMDKFAWTLHKLGLMSDQEYQDYLNEKLYVPQGIHPEHPDIVHKCTISALYLFT